MYRRDIVFLFSSPLVTRARNALFVAVIVVSAALVTGASNAKSPFFVHELGHAAICINTYNANTAWSNITFNIIKTHDHQIHNLLS